MANSIICKGCGNGDLTKMVFIENNRYVHCLVCNAVTPLYSDYVVQEVTGSVRMEGVRSFDERLANGYNLLKLEDFAEAGEEFEELKGDYSSDYRTWFGYSLAKTRNLSVDAGLPYDAGLLARVAQTAKGNAAAQAMVTEAYDYYNKSNLLYSRLFVARQEHADKYEEMTQLENATSPSLYRKGDLETSLSNARYNLDLNNKYTAKLRIGFFLFAIIAVAAAWFVNGHVTGNTRASDYFVTNIIGFGALAIGGIGAIRNLFKLLQNMPGRARIKGEVRNYTRELSDLNSEVEHFNDANRRKIDTVNRDISQKDRAITDCDKELADHKATFDQLFTKWVGQMGVKI